MLAQLWHNEDRHTRWFLYIMCLKNSLINIIILLEDKFVLNYTLNDSIVKI